MDDSQRSTPLPETRETPVERPPNRMLKWFGYEHLPAPLQGVSRPFGVVAQAMDAELPESAEKTAGMRKLLEAKDCFVRAAIERGAGLLLALFVLATSAWAQTPVHNLITGGTGPSVGIFSTQVCATQGPFGQGGVSHHAGGAAPIEFRTTYHILASSSVAIGMVSLGTAAPLCGVQLSTFLAGSTGLLIVDPTAPAFISLDLCANAGPAPGGYTAWRHSTWIDAVDWPLAPGWDWHVQIFEWDTSGDLHAAPWAVTHHLYAF